MNQCNSKKISYKQSDKANVFALMLVFIWFFMSQAAVIHASKHRLDFDNNCITCIAQNNLSSATLNSNISVSLVQSSQWFDVPFRFSLVSIEHDFFAARDPPLFS
ncbi:MAG: hypothetical protein Q9M92_01570 [Enterobacterales bacterium]|nr:hypothetical protein [Enterobacterales bacterium]